MPFDRRAAQVLEFDGVAEDFEGSSRKSLDVEEPAEQPVSSVFDHLAHRRRV